MSGASGSTVPILSTGVMHHMPSAMILLKMVIPIRFFCVKIKQRIPQHRLLVSPTATLRSLEDDNYCHPECLSLDAVDCENDPLNVRCQVLSGSGHHH